MGLRKSCFASLGQKNVEGTLTVWETLRVTTGQMSCAHFVIYNGNEILQNGLVCVLVELHYLNMMHETIMNCKFDYLHTSGCTFPHLLHSYVPLIFFTLFHVMHCWLELFCGVVVMVDPVSPFCKHFQVFITLVALSCDKSKLVIINSFCKGVEIRHSNQFRLSNGSSG